MKKLAGYAENPFDTMDASREDIAVFFGDHNSRLRQAVTNGEPFADLLAPTALATANLVASQSKTVTSRTNLKSLTRSVNLIIAAFKTKARESEAIVLTHFKTKNSPRYIEFFPNGRSGYSVANKNSILPLMDQIIKAATDHKELIGEEMSLEFAAMKEEYISARETQQKQKENKSNSTGTWDENLEVMKNQAFDNLQVICRVHKNHPERISTYFDTSIVTYAKHAAPASKQ